MKPIKDFENYKITNSGQVYNRKGKLLSLQENIDGYWVINLYKNGKYHHCRCARLVGLTYLYSSYQDGYVINHKNLNVKDDRVENLEWVTVKENCHHSIKAQPSIHRKPSNYSESLIRKICKDMEDGVRNSEILKKYNVTRDTILHIRCKQSWKWVSDDFDIKPSRKGISESTALWVCHKLNEGLSYKEILEVSTCKYLTIHVLKRIKNRKSWKQVSDGVLKV